MAEVEFNKSDTYYIQRNFTFQLVRLSCTHNSALTTSMDQSQPNQTVQNMRKSEAWVWGSNTSHQLAEGLVFEHLF